MGGRMEFDFNFGGGAGRPRPRRAEGGPFRLLLIADFSGRAVRRARGEAVALGRPREVDAADIDRTFADLDVTLPVGPSGAEEETAFRSLDDLHPDALFRRLSLFETPRNARAALAA
ncbi:MAG: hypothetical protein ABUR63_07950, partial [Verrucomicrobiota bacterium]